MSQTNEMCCFCLSTTSVLIDLFSKSGDLTHFDKLSSTLSQLANVLNEFGHNEYMFCVKCCETIHMIYQFNRTCLNNVRTLFSSQKEIVEDKTEQEQSKNAIETNNIQHENRDEPFTIVEIKTETSLDSLFNDDATEDLHISHDVLIKKETDQTSNMMDFCQINITEGKQSTADMESAASQKNIELSNPKAIANLNQIAELSSISEKNWYELQGSSELIYENEHMNKSTKGYTCDLCNENFIQRRQLTKHRLIHGPKPYQCPICTKSFSRRDYLERHMIYVHTDEKPYKCQFCPKSFKSPEHIDRHNLIHSGEKPFSCESCGKSFRDKTTLDRHQKIHVNKPFSCHICCKSFKEEVVLNRHLMLHPILTTSLEKKDLCSEVTHGQDDKKC